MYSSVSIIFLVFGLININQGAVIVTHSDNVAIDVPLPRGYTRAQYEKSVRDFWTPERMASATPLDFVLPLGRNAPYSDVILNNEPERVLTPSAPLLNARAANPPAAGRVFFKMGASTYVCSGSVVNSGNRATVVTAGHCVFNTTSKEYVTDFQFIPAYENNNRPYGTFVANKLVTKDRWMSNADYNHDVAIVRVGLNENGEYLQDKTGAFGISLNAQKNAQTNAFGYPMNMNSGQTMSTCSDVSVAPNLLLMSSFKGLQITCGMTGGSSGGPWLQNYNSVTNAGQQVSVTSFGYSLAPGKIHGPHFIQDNIGSLHDEHHNS